MKPLLEIRNLTVRYATDGAVVTAVRDVSFELAPGRAIGLVGESGSGKSTVAGAILDLLHGDAVCSRASISAGATPNSGENCWGEGLEPSSRIRLRRSIQQ